MAKTSESSLDRQKTVGKCCAGCSTTPVRAEPAARGVWPEAVGGGLDRVGNS